MSKRARKKASSRPGPAPAGDARPASPSPVAPVGPEATVPVKAAAASVPPPAPPSPAGPVWHHSPSTVFERSPSATCAPS
jgi:hypothetical protein